MVEPFLGGYSARVLVIFGLIIADTTQVIVTDMTNDSFYLVIFLVRSVQETFIPPFCYLFFIGSNYTLFAATKLIYFLKTLI